MSQVIYLKAMTDASLAPCVVFVDLQREYITDTRLLALAEPTNVLANCRAVLRHARTMGFPIAHVRQAGQSSFFNPTTSFFDWIKGFEPTSADMVFERNKPSCYSNRLFSDLMESCGGHFVLAGFAGETACLSTAVDAYHRNHHFTYLADASASHRLGHLSPNDVQSAVTEIVGVYGDTANTEKWIAATSPMARAM
jgi:nicotinamidase-related amidase